MRKTERPTHGQTTLLAASVDLGPVAWQWGEQCGQSPGGTLSSGALEFQAKEFKKNNFPVTVKIRTSGYQTLECFIATLPT